jgi:hypothetical protein
MPFLLAAVLLGSPTITGVCSTARPAAGTPVAGGSAPILPFGPPPPTYPVTFTESSLPEGAIWTLTIGGIAWNSSSRALMVAEPNGTQRFSAYSDSLYVRPFVNGSFDVQGGPETVVLNWTLANGSAAVAPGVPSASTSASSAGPGLAWISGAVVLILAIVVVSLGIQRRRSSEDAEAPPRILRQETDPAGDRSPLEPARDRSREDPLAHML